MAAMKTPRLLPPLLALLLPILASAATTADPIDDYILDQMRKHHVAGLSLAIIEGGRIVKVRGYGVTDKQGGAPVTPETLFQAGSISKAVTALGVLHLVEQGRLSLDADVNTELTTWKLPENEYTRKKAVTLRDLLSHSAGLTVHGFPGYAVDAPLPMLVQVLDGQKPANTQPIRVDILPGSQWRYSGGGYLIVQQMVLDATGQSFPEFMNATVLGPLGMAQSTFEQPLPPERAQQTATGYYPDGSRVEGRWHVYPELAAAGLWTTASDLARFAIGVQQAMAGASHAVISPEMAREMLTGRMLSEESLSGLKEDDGLGVFVAGEGQSQLFSHGGGTKGFVAMVVAYTRTGQGAVVMMNTDDDSNFRILQRIAEIYHWPGYPRLPPPSSHPARLSDQALNRYAGYYKMPGGVVLTLEPEKGLLVVSRDLTMLDEFLPESEMAFYSQDLGIRLMFDTPSGGVVDRLVRHKVGVPPGPEQDLSAPRIGPLASAVRAEPDPDPSLTARVNGLLEAWKGGGGQAVARLPYVTPVAQKNMAGRPGVDLSEFTLTYLTAQDLRRRQIDRNGSVVSRVLYYRLQAGAAARTLLVYLTVEGLVTDADIVGG
jgi:CubicO group peptidase (beta-lactamase class C family)